MKHITLFLIAMLFSVTAFAQQTYDNEFTQTRVMKVSGKTINKTGHLTFDGEDHLTMNYSSPEGEYFIIEGDKVKMNMDGKKNELDANKLNMVKLQRATLINCLSGYWEQVAEDNNAESTIKEKDGLCTIFLKVKEKAVIGGYSALELTYRIADGKLVKMMLEEATGTRNTYEIH